MKIVIRTLSIAFFLLSQVLSGHGQNVFQPKPIDYNLKGLVYSSETVFEGRIHMNGFAVGLKKGTLKTYNRTSYFGIEFGYLKDGRERRQNKNISVAGERISSSFIYGKRSQFYTLRFALGEKRYLSEKTRRKGVAVGFIYEGGASLGLIKPYYLKVIRTEDDRVTRAVETIRYSEDTRNDFLDFDQIYGGTSFLKGFENLSPTVGLHGKLAMHWGIGAFEKQVKAVESGVMVDIYPKKIPLLVERDEISNKFYFVKLYLSFQIGYRRL